MSAPAVTAFAETAALYAVMTEDLPGARRIVGDMLPGERAQLAQQLDQLRELLGPRCDGCDALTPIGTSVLTDPLSPKRQYLCRDCAAAPTPALAT
jgi:hypothetical protein